ncbi:hypothetical protein J3R30DRAFT_414991 [Lentinula aciculospora]|uniref:Uncharacterized protein n=1 Tax=Lentinula aciculospora TaxID=153920 RepID=A0A9W9A7C5_9AGAR|nr:hypothetical protein J3R30DRAFT_414991 [Lentinula aciculospora]
MVPLYGSFAFLHCIDIIESIFFGYIVAFRTVHIPHFLLSLSLVVLVCCSSCNYRYRFHPFSIKFPAPIIYTLAPWT